MIRLRTIVAVALTALALVATGAYAGARITGAQIEDGTIGSQDVRDESLTIHDLNWTLQNRIRSGLTSPAVPVPEIEPTECESCG